MPINRFTDDSLRDITASLFVAGDKQFVLGTKVIPHSNNSTSLFQSGSLFLFDIPNSELVETVMDAHSGTVSQMCTLPDKVRISTILIVCFSERLRDV